MSEMPESAISAGAHRLIEAAEHCQRHSNHPTLSVFHWLSALLERHGGMAADLSPGLEVVPLLRGLVKLLGRGQVGAPLSVETLIAHAQQYAQARGKAQATERDLAIVILATAGYSLNGSIPSLPTMPVTPAAGSEIPPPPSEATPAGEGAPSAAPPAVAAPPGQSTPTYLPRTQRPTPTLDRYGQDLTRVAAEGRLHPVVGREEEIQLVMETLCRRTKRNPVLVGPAGVGKTAIVEGLAQRIVRGEVPELLRNVRVVAVQPSTIVSGASLSGELEKRMQAILAEANQDGLIIFIDELHSMIGAGGGPGSNDVASLLKPALARGDIACIGATTDDEYRRFLEPDEALARRFQPVRIHEPDPQQTFVILQTLRDNLVRLRGVAVDDEILHWLIAFAQTFLRNRYFPDKAVDLLEQVVAYALTQRKGRVEESDAETVAQRLVGMPLDLHARLNALRARLAEQPLLTEEGAQTLLNRLEVSTRGLDLRPSRPSAVVLLAGEAAQASEALAEALAETLFGSPERVISINFSRFTNPADVSMLIGAPPGYVGYSDALVLHRVAQMPWSVLRCEQVQACHPQVREVLTQALSDGYLTDARGKRIYLSETIVLLTVGLDAQAQRRFGFARGDEPMAERQARLRDIAPIVERLVGTELVAQADLICSELPASDDTVRRRWQKQRLDDLAERYRAQGVKLLWDESLVDWLLEQKSAQGAQRNWERLVDEQLSPRLIPHLPASHGQAVTLRVAYREGHIQVEPQPTTEGER